MRPFLEWPIIRQLHQRALLFPAGLAVAAVAVLAQGALQHRSEPTAETAATSFPTPEPPPLLPRLRPDLEKTPLSYLSDYWLQLAEGARPSLVRLGREGWPGIVVAQGIAVTSPTLAQALRAEANAGPEPRFEVEVRELGLAVVTLDAARAGQPFELAPLEEARPGSLVATISLRPDGRLRVTPAHLASVGSSDPPGGGTPWDTVPGARLELSVLPADLTAGAVVDLDGGLLALALVGRDGDVRLLPATLVLEALQQEPGAPCRALAVAPLAPGVRGLLGRDGVVVEAVRGDAFPAAPGIEPGDVLLQWEANPVADVAAFATSYDGSLGRRVGVLLLRRGALLRRTLLVPGPDCRPAQPEPVRLDSIGLELRWADELEPPAWQVVGVGPGSAAAAVGLLPGDRLLAVSGRPVSGVNARGRLEALGRSRRATLLEVARGERVTLRALPTPTPTPSPEPATAAPPKPPADPPETPL